MANTQRRLVPSPTDLNYAFLMENIHTYSLEDEIARWPNPPRLYPQTGHSNNIFLFLSSDNSRTGERGIETRSRQQRNLQQINTTTQPASLNNHTVVHPTPIPSFPTKIYLRLYPIVPASRHGSGGNSEEGGTGTGSSRNVVG